MALNSSRWDAPNEEATLTYASNVALISFTLSRSVDPPATTTSINKAYPS